MKARFRVGCVPYVNARPLVACFDQPNEFVEVVYDVPSRLPALLDSGEVDAILVSSIEYLRRDDLVIAADVGIMSNGPVASVRMLSKVPLEEITTLALDESSMTSNMLAQVILAERGVRPSLVTMAPDQSLMLERCDACVLIGDKGLEADGTGLVDVDLGQAWTEMTGEPFVWALWLSRRDRFPKPKWDEKHEGQLLWMTLFYGFDASGFDSLHQSLDYPKRKAASMSKLEGERLERQKQAVATNIEHMNCYLEANRLRIDFVVQDAANRSGWTQENVANYLTHNVRYRLLSDRTLDMFGELLLNHGLVPKVREKTRKRFRDELRDGIFELIPVGNPYDPLMTENNTSVRVADEEKR